MNIWTLTEMAAAAMGDRVLFGGRDGGLTAERLADSARRAAAVLAARGVERVGLVDANSNAVPVALFGGAIAGTPYVPLNYRLADDRLAALLARIAPALVVVDDAVSARVGDIDGVELITRDKFLAEVAAADPDAAPAASGDPDEVAVLLFTSGTTGEPKAAVLRHGNLTSYVLSTVEFMGAAPEHAALVSVPPYHIAGTSAVLTSAYSGRRVVYMEAFSPEEWVRLARDEAVTHAMVVPTMLRRILDVLEREGGTIPSLAHLSYGGGRMPVAVIEQAMALLPSVSFVNAYGLTETSSTIALLGPDDHREALASADPAVRGRLGSVGRPLPSVEIEIRDDSGAPAAVGERGEIYVRGEQVSGQYEGRSALTSDGWFPTNDAGWLDGDGFLFVEGRLDDVIVRGGENISPGEVEDVLTAHPTVADAAVVGVPDREWGEKVVAAVVAADGALPSEDELRDWVRSQLRSSRAPEHVAVVEELPYNDTGKLVRRTIRADLAARYATD